MKSIWLTSLSKSEEQIQQIAQKMKAYGLSIDGAYWEDDLKKMAWLSTLQELLNPMVKLWMIYATEEELQSESIRYGLFALSICLQNERGHTFPIAMIYDGGSPPPVEMMPTPLKEISFFSLTETSYPAKIVAKVHSTVKPVTPEYRLNLRAIPQIGYWYEIGPREGVWNGAMLGVDQGEINFQAVGPKGALPDKSKLISPRQGLKLSYGESEFTAWSVENEIDSESSYYARIEGTPKSILFGENPTGDESDVFVVQSM